jgi:hypothetical protein
MTQKDSPRSNWLAVMRFLYGDTPPGAGFWYQDPIREVEGLTADQLFWIPDPHSLCLLWQVGHIACRERLHLSAFCQGLPVSKLWPEPYDVFGADWVSVDQVKSTVGDIEPFFSWVRQARRASQEYIRALQPEDYLLVPENSVDGFTVAHWLTITACHTALHIGRIQVLRAMIEGKPERAC